MNFSRLHSVFRLPSVKRLLAFALLAEIPAGMTALAIVLRITESGGSYARAGLVSGVQALGVGVSAPLWSRLIDRRGQTIALVPTAIAVTAAAFVLAALPPTGALIPLVVAAIAMGLVQPPALVSARTLWPQVVRDPLLLETTYSVEAAMTELIFMLGPLLAVIVTVGLGPASAVAASGLLAGLGALGLASSAASRHTQGRRRVARAHGALRSPAVRVLVLATFALVVAFGAVDVTTVAAARGPHNTTSSGTGTAGIMIALWAGGSLLGGLAFGARSWPGRRSTQLIVLIATIGVLTATLIPLSNLVALTAVLFLSGLFNAPSFSCINQTVQKVAVPGASTESFAWIGTGALVGAALGTALAGYAVTHGGTMAGYSVAAGSLAIAAAIVILGRRTIRTGDVIVDAPSAEPVPGSVG